MKSEIVDLDLRIIYETDKAFLLTDSDDPKTKKGVWWPKSQMEIHSIVAAKVKGQRIVSFSTPRWIAEEKDMV